MGEGHYCTHKNVHVQLIEMLNRIKSISARKLSPTAGRKKPRKPHDDSQSNNVLGGTLKIKINLP